MFGYEEGPRVLKERPPVPLPTGTMRPLEFSFILLIMKMICFIKEKNYVIMTFPTGANVLGIREFRNN
jgi:hypothetical protein